MRVLVTGGTGFVGCHTVAALVGHGHQVRLLVRDPERIAPALGPLGIAQVDAVVGDVTNPATVEQAMGGCDAVVHAACVYSLDPRCAAVMAQTNPTGTDLVPGAAHRQGLDPIIYVSSVGVFWPTTTARLTAGSRLGTGVGPYTRSKLAAELVDVREVAALHAAVLRPGRGARGTCWPARRCRWWTWRGCWVN